jgi:hypothetical protein
MRAAVLHLTIVSKRMLTLQEAAQHCGRSVKRFEIECPVAAVVFPNGDRRFDVHDLDKWLAPARTPELDAAAVFSGPTYTWQSRYSPASASRTRSRNRRRTPPRRQDNLASHKISGVARYLAALAFGRYWPVWEISRTRKKESGHWGNADSIPLRGVEFETHTRDPQLTPKHVCASSGLAGKSRHHYSAAPPSPTSTNGAQNAGCAS